MPYGHHHSAKRRQSVGAGCRHHASCLPRTARRITATIIETVASQVGFRIDKGLALACFRVKQIKSVGGRNNQPARRAPRQTTHRLAKIKTAIHARCRIKPVNEPRLDINPPQAGILCIPYRPSPSRAGDDTAISISTVIYRPSSIVMACPTELSGRAPSTLKNRAKSLVWFWLIGFGLIGMRHSLFYPISAMKTSTKHMPRIRQIHRYIFEDDILL